MVNKRLDYAEADVRNKARELYENSGITIKALSERSVELLGVFVDAPTLGGYQTNDGWVKNSDFGDLDILIKLMDLIEDRLSSGDDLSAMDLSRLTDAYSKLINIKDKLNIINVTSSAEKASKRGRMSILK